MNKDCKKAKIFSKTFERRQNFWKNVLSMTKQIPKSYKTKNNYVSILNPHVIEAKPLLKVQKTFSLKKKDLKVFRFFRRIIFFLSRKNRELINSFCSFSHSTFNLNGGHRNLTAISIK